ncbi:MAG TPA: S41 family peptidase [Polyangia bacterium]|jgi:carboxyl-terminal processing protease|nr:S41 family peptidase [Polyangia bacterium]
MLPPSRSSRASRVALLALLVASAFGAGMVFSRPTSAGRFNPYQKLGIFTKVLSYIESHYVEDIQEQELMYGAARGLTDVLDPHSRFMDPEEYDRLKKEMEGNEEIEGIGIDVEKRKTHLVIISPIEGSPAAKAGIEPGDVIRRVDGVDVGPLEFDEAVGRMQGPPGSEVVLVVERRGREMTFRIKRGRYELKPVEGKLLDDGIAYVKLRIFSATTDPMLGDMLDQLNAKAQGLRGLVLDLRRNPGGSLDSGIRVADRFIADGLIVKTVGKGGHVIDEAKAHSRGTWMGFPMVVVVDGATASAAEIVAGALQDHGRAVILGTQTFGKGSVQTVIDLDGCGAKPCGLKLTMARYYTPSGRSIQGQGITPDVVVESTAPAPDPDDADLPRERDLRKRLKNEQGDKAQQRQRLDDYQVQMALDYLRSWSLFQRQIGKK